MPTRHQKKRKPSKSKLSVKRKADLGASKPKPDSASAPSSEAPNEDSQEVGHKFARTFAPPELYDPKKRRQWKVENEPGDRGPYVIELNLQHIGGLAGALAELRKLHQEHLKDAPPPRQVSKTYLGWDLTVQEWQILLHEDERQALAQSTKRQIDSMRFRAIYKLWPDFPVQSQIYRSLATIKANAAQRSFEAEGEGIVWAVIDSGIDGTHQHFKTHGTLQGPAVRDLHRSFVRPETNEDGVLILGDPLADPDDPALSPVERAKRIEEHVNHALTDDFGHGTHVAGIIAGAAPKSANGIEVCVLERIDQIEPNGERMRGSSSIGEFRDASRVHGVAPLCQLVSLRVLDNKGDGRSSDVIRALEYVREKLNDNPKLLRVHGVNLSVGYEFDAEMFACGQSPICAEVNRLVQSGVVVVAAAGNTGYGTIAATTRNAKVSLSNTINDPGNSELAITVGATHRDAPYMYGVSYFSSKGPTGDGRLKPDLVAPGERITSCGAGARLKQAIASAGAGARPPPGVELAYYTEDSGTSMAAPHVSGAVAAFLSIRREFIGRPLEVKKIFTSTASPLGRERYFEGHGLVDLVRAIQSV